MKKSENHNVPIAMRSDLLERPGYNRLWLWFGLSRASWFVGMIVALIGIFFLTGCDPRQGMVNVRKDFPAPDEITGIPGCSYEWIIRETNGAVWFAENQGFGTSQTIKVLLMPAR